MNAITVQTPDDSLARLERLSVLSQRLLERARECGASQAEVSCSEETGLNVNVRMGAVETVESNRDRGIGVTVYFGKRKGSASTADLREESLNATVEQACAIARYTEDDEASGLAEPELMARSRDLADDITHNAPLSVTALKRFAHFAARRPDPHGEDKEIRRLEDGVWESADAMSGLKAYIDKRPVEFVGR